MTVASTYAAAYAASQGVIGAPAPFVGPSGGRLEISSSGDLKMVPPPGGGVSDIPAAAVPSVIAWLTANFVT
jgi:hypothetical protein